LHHNVGAVSLYGGVVGKCLRSAIVEAHLFSTLLHMLSLGDPLMVPCHSPRPPAQLGVGRACTAFGAPFLAQQHWQYAVGCERISWGGGCLLFRVLVLAVSSGGMGLTLPGWPSCL
jgi:hypothetical protein